MSIRNYLTLFLFTVIVSVFSVNASPKGGNSELWNFDWEFRYSEESQWKKLDLPHDMQIGLAWDQSARKALAFKPRTSGWYRKSFKADPSWKNQNVLVDFEGVLVYADVYLNGKRVGGTNYGYVGFECDITANIDWSGDNELTVFADTGGGDSRWYTGGGIFRDVHLNLRPATSFARHGLFVYTPLITKDKAKLNVQVDVQGQRWKDNALVVNVEIFSPSGQKVASKSIQPIRKSNLAIDELLVEMELDKPELWSCENPSLYTAKAELVLDGKVIDSISDRFGVRTLEYGSEFGFKLNGEKVLLKGISNHHDMGAVGAAAFESSIRRQFETLKAFGFNSIRCSHNPYSDSFYRIADEMGILIVDELYDKWCTESFWAGRGDWTDSWPTDIPEWVKSHRNHPSVILWSLGNEFQMSDHMAGYPSLDWGVTTYKMLDIYLKRWDPTRLTTAAMFPSFANSIRAYDFITDKNLVKAPELSLVTDVASYNYRWPNFNSYWEEKPELIIYQSEAATIEMGACFFGMNLDKVVGLAYWGAIEYWGESNAWPWKGWHYSFFDHTLNPYPQAYFIKSIFSDEPIVQIGFVDGTDETITWNDVQVGRLPLGHSWNFKKGQKVNIMSFSNAEEVELFVNGRSFGKQKNDTTDINNRNYFRWKDVPYASGRVTAIARTAGKEVARHEVRSPGKAVALKIALEKSGLKADGMDLMYLRVLAVDSKGQIVTTATGDVNVEVDGAAKLLAVDSGDHRSDELFDSGTRTLYKGSILAIVRAGRNSGNVNVRANSTSGLKPAELSFVCN